MKNELTSTLWDIGLSGLPTPETVRTPEQADNLNRLHAESEILSEGHVWPQRINIKND